jgi:lipoprotein-releasing system permease protein
MAFVTQEKIAQLLGPMFVVNNWQENDKMLFEALRTEKTMMFILLFFIAIVAAFCVTNTLIVITIQKTPEIGLLKALGFSNRQLKLAFILNGQIQCLIGLALGVLLGWVVLVNLQGLVAALSNIGIEVFPKEIYGLNAIPYRIVVSDVLSTVGAVFILCSLASLLPAWRASSLDPIKAMNQE